MLDYSSAQKTQRQVLEILKRQSHQQSKILGAHDKISQLDKLSPRRGPLSGLGMKNEPVEPKQSPSYLDTIMNASATGAQSRETTPSKGVSRLNSIDPSVCKIMMQDQQ